MKRNTFLEHVAWTGAGIVWTMGAAGVLTAQAHADPGTFNFVQISDSHIGFHRPENPDVSATLQKTVDSINALSVQPAFIVHTGDITHLATPAQFDTARQILGTLRAPLVALPGEHDTIGGPANYFTAMHPKGAKDGWFSFDRGGVHFIGIVNVFDFENMGLIGEKQLDWLAKDIAAQTSSTPLVVFGHVPLYALYEPWGWTTRDGARVLSMLARFGHVTVLNGHIHQIIQHTEGNIRFATAASTAYPQPAPGTAAKPGPLQVPPDHLLKVIGYRTVQIAATGGATIGERPLA